MSPILQLIGENLTPQIVDQIATKVGGENQAVRAAIGAGVPLLLNALGRNASTSEGAEQVTSALRRDHDGGLLGQLGELVLGNVSGKQADGAGILEHVLGSNRTQVERGVSKTTGLDLGQVASLLPILAPIVMNAIGKIRADKDLEADGVQNLLQVEKEKTDEGLGGLAGLIDADGDGSIADDLIGIGAKLFGGFGGR